MTKAFIDRMSRRAMRRIELEFYTAIATPSFFAANPQLPATTTVSTRGPMPEPYYHDKQHMCGPACSRLSLRLMDYC